MKFREVPPQRYEIALSPITVLFKAVHTQRIFYVNDRRVIVPRYDLTREDFATFDLFRKAGVKSRVSPQGIYESVLAPYVSDGLTAREACDIRVSSGKPIAPLGLPRSSLKGVAIHKVFAVFDVLDSLRYVARLNAVVRAEFHIDVKRHFVDYVPADLVKFATHGLVRQHEKLVRLTLCQLPIHSARSAYHQRRLIA